MINWLRTLWCTHEIEVVEDECWVRPSFDSMNTYLATRKFMICKKCGYTKKISKR